MRIDQAAMTQCGIASTIMALRKSAMPLVRCNTKSPRDAGQTRRLLSASQRWHWPRCDGGSRSDAVRTGGVAVQIVRDWVVRFNTEGRDVPLNRKMVGARSILDDSQRQGLRRMVEDDPIPAVHGVVRWRLIDLAWPIFKSTLSRELRNMGTRQALGKAAPSRARRGSRCGFQKRMARFQRQSRANAVKKLRRMSTRPSGRSLPSSQATASAKAQCISNPMIAGRSP